MRYKNQQSQKERFEHWGYIVKVGYKILRELIIGIVIATLIINTLWSMLMHHDKGLYDLIFEGLERLISHI